MESSPDETASGSPPGSIYRWYVIGVLNLGLMSALIDRRVLNLLVEPIRQDLGLSDTQISLLLGFSFALFFTTLGIPIGRLADSRSRRAILTASISVWSVMTAACGLATNYAQLFLARAGVGVGQAGYTPTAMSLIAGYFPGRRRSTAISIYLMGAYTGTGLALMIGGTDVIFQDLAALRISLALIAPGLLLATMACLIFGLAPFRRVKWQTEDSK